MKKNKTRYLGARFTEEEKEKILDFIENRNYRLSDLIREAVFSHMYNLKNIEKK
jgi:hypothetical protein